MLVPYLQGVLAMAHEMDTATGDAKKVAQLKGYGYFSMVQSVLAQKAPAATANLGVCLQPSSSCANNYCAAHHLITNNLPNASGLQYQFAASSSASHQHVTDGDDSLHLTERDIGALVAAAAVTCAAPSSPSAGVAPLYQTVTEVTGAGNVADYTPSVQSQMRIKIAGELGVAYSAVTIAVTSGSVKIKLTVTYATETAAAAGTTALAAKMASPATASAFLSTPAFSVTVSSVDTAPSTQSVNASSSSLSGGELAAIIAGSIVGVLLLLALIYFIQKRKAKGTPIFTCLDETKKPATGASA